MLAIQGTNLLRFVFVKDLLFRNSQASSRPHVGGINVLLAVAIKIEPAGAHPRADFINASSCGDRCKSSFAVVAIEIVPPKVVDHIQIWRTIAVCVAPGASKTVAVVLRIQPRGFGSIQEGRIAFVVQQEVGRTIPRVEVRCWVVILVEAYIVAVQTEIDIESSIAVIVRRGSVRKGTLRGLDKLESITLALELSIPLIQEQKRPTAANHQQVLQPLVLEISE